MLTALQKTCLEAIQDYQSAHGGISPSYADILARIGVGCKSQVHHLVTQLEERGFVRRIPNRARAIEVLKKTAPRQMIRREVPVVSYPDASYFVVERIAEKAVLVPLQKRAT